MAFSCVLVAEANRYGQAAFEGLVACGIQIETVWCRSPEHFLLRTPFSHLLGSRKHRESQSFAKLLSDHGASVKQISPPFAANLTTALDQHSDIDFILVAGSSIIFPKSFLEELQIPIINFHPALLPAYRGPSPIHDLVLNDEADTYGGITAHLLTAKIDAGPIIKQYKENLSDYGSVAAWEAAIHKRCHDLVAHGVMPFLRGEIRPIEQDESQASYFSMDQVPRFISPSMSFVEAKSFSEKSKHLFYNTKLSFLDARSRPKTLRVVGSPNWMSLPTGQPAKVRFQSIELDLSDARAQFQLNNRPRRLWAKLRRLVPLRGN